MELAKMTSKGQLTVPVSIRKKLGIGAGDQLLFYEREGQIILAPVTPASLAAAQAAAAQQHVYSLEEIREIAVPIAQRHQLKRLTLFGSYARGEATAQSDLDFRADVPADFGMFRLSALQGDLEDAFHKYYLDETKMFRYARRRNVETRMKAFIRQETGIKLRTEE